MSGGGERRSGSRELALGAVSGLLSGLSGCADVPRPVSPPPNASQGEQATPLECPAVPDDPTQATPVALNAPAASAPPSAPAKPGEIVGRIKKVGPRTVVIETATGQDVVLNDLGELEVFAPSWVPLGRGTVVGIKAGELRVAREPGESTVELLEGAQVRFRVGALAEPAPPEPRDCCKGMNECKGQGNCKTHDNDCAGKNECKGQGGCKPVDC